MDEYNMVNPDESELLSLINAEPPTAEETVKRKALGLLIAIAALIVSLCVIIAAALLIPYEWGLWSTAIGEIALLVVALLFALMLRQPLRVTFPLYRPNKNHISGSIFLFAGAWCLTYVTSIAQSALFPRATELSEQISDFLTSDVFWVSFVVVCVLPGICEEALCRGTMLSSLRFKNIWLRIAIGGALFGILHGDFLRMLPTAVLGMSFCYITLKTGNLLYTVVLHGFNNLVSLGFTYISDFLLKMSDDLGEYSSDVATAEVTAEMQAASLVMLVGMGVLFLGAALLFIYGGGRRLNNLSLGDVSRKTRRTVQIISIILLVLGFVVMAVSCGAVAAMSTENML